MNIILIILLSLYGVYCINFISALCYVIYKEREEERRTGIIEVSGFIDSDEEN